MKRKEVKEQIKALNGKSVEELNVELLAVRKDQFNLRMQAALGQQPKNHLIRAARKSIARIKTITKQKAGV